MRKLTWFPNVLLIPFLSACIFNVNTINLPIGPQPLQEKELFGEGKDKIVLLDLSGVISDREKAGTLVTHPSMVAQIKEALDKAAKDANVKAILLRINSPGGTVTASDLLYHEITQFKKVTGKKVVAVIMDIGASGGYYAAVAADTIIAHPTTVTGSIGVIMLNLNVEGLLEKIGVSGQAIKSGEKKDMGSPFRSITDEERQIFQGIIDQMFDRFVTVVAEGRPNLSVEQVRKISDGRIYTAEQALELGLVDQIGYLSDAIEVAKKQAGISKARVVTYHRPGSYSANIYSKFPPNGVGTLNLVNLDLRSFLSVGTPEFMYLWVP